MNKNITTYSDFLADKEFIKWRLTRITVLEEQWTAFIAANNHLREEFEKAISICESIRINEKKHSGTDLLYQQILERISAKHKINRRKKIIYYTSSVAATILLLIVTTFYFINKQSETSTRLIANEEVIGRTNPGQTVQLIVDSTIITLGQNTKIELTDEELSYTDSTNLRQSIKVANTKYNKLIVPNGKRSSLVLADGSTVWINSGSEIEFPSEFTDKKREIKVVGEIFINVVKSGNKPFFVQTPKLEVKVYGTSFNVSAYDNDEETSVVLVDGSVQVKTADNKSMMMTSNEMVALKNGHLKKEKVDVAFYTSWKDGVYVFYKSPASELFKKVGRYYNISFDTTISSDKKITGKLYLHNKLEDVLESVSLLTGKQYIVENDIIKVKN